MNGGEIFVLCIIAMALGAGIVKHYLRTQSAKPQEDPETRSKLARIDELERRVQTLERIVTDKGYDLKREFDKL